VHLPRAYPSAARPTLLLQVDSSASCSHVLAQLDEEVPSTGDAICSRLSASNSGERESITAPEQTRRAQVEPEERERRIRLELEEHAFLLAVEAIETAEKEPRLSAFEQDESVNQSSSSSTTSHER
jgi:hypothetical protein